LHGKLNLVHRVAIHKFLITINVKPILISRLNESLKINFSLTSALPDYARYFRSSFNTLYRIRIWTI